MPRCLDAACQPTAMSLLSDLCGCALRNQRDEQETKGGYVTTPGTGGPGHLRVPWTVRFGEL
jgi:hypothetical protein